MIELAFHSDTNQQLAQQVLQDAGIHVRRGQPGFLEIDRADLVNNLPQIEDVLGQFNGRIWSD